MKSALRIFATPLLVCLFAAFSTGPEYMVRFYVETNAQSADRFTSEIKFNYPPRTGYIERIPAVSEKNVVGIYPYEASDGSWGCTFQLDASGRLALQTVSTEQRGRSMVAMAGTKKGVRQVIDMIIDKPIMDGVITIPRGLTLLEIDALQKHYPNVRGKSARVPIPKEELDKLKALKKQKPEKEENPSADASR